MEEWARNFRCLQLLQSRANETCSRMIGAVKVLFVSVLIRSIYGAIKMEGITRLLSLSAAMFSIGFLGVLFKVYGQVWAGSRAVLMARRKGIPREEKWFRAFHRSCQPLKFDIAGLYFVDPGMSLTLGSFVVQNMANLLILGA